MAMTQKDIADALGNDITPSNVQYWLKKNNLWKKKYMFSEESVAFMKDNYKTMEYSEIAKHLNLTELQVRGKLNNMGLTKLRKFDKRYFRDVDSSIKAYFLGFIYADGWVVYNQKRRNYEFGMQLQACDKYILDSLNDVLGGVHKIIHIKPCKKVINGVNTISNDSYRIRIYSKDIVEDLISHGITPDKTHNYKLPEFSMKYFFDFLRGYIDGDGCYYDSGKNISMNITCASYDVLEWIRHILLSYNISTHIYKEKELKYRICCYDKESIKTLINLLYRNGDDCICLSRKYNKIKHLLNGRPD